MAQPLGLSDFFKIVFGSFVIIPFVLLKEWSFPRNNAQSTIQLRKWKLCKHFLDRVNFKVSQSHGLWSHALNCKTHTCFKLQFKRSNAGINLWNRKTTVRLKLWFRLVQRIWNTGIVKCTESTETHFTKQIEFQAIGKPVCFQPTSNKNQIA